MNLVTEISLKSGGWLPISPENGDWPFDLQMKTPEKRMRGFTLVELMVTLAVAAILLTVGIPSFQSVIQDNRMTTSVNDFLLYLNYARSEAIKRGRTVTVCIHNGSGACNTAITAAWQNGLLIWVDTDNDSSVDADEQLKMGRAENGITLTSTVFASSIQFTATGSTVGNATGHFKFCDSRGTAFARAVLVNSTGRPQLSRDGSDADTTHEAPAGTNLSCP